LAGRKSLLCYTPSSWPGSVAYIGTGSTTPREQGNLLPRPQNSWIIAEIHAKDPSQTITPRIEIRTPTDPYSQTVFSGADPGAHSSCGPICLLAQPPNWLRSVNPELASFRHPTNWLRLGQPELGSFGAPEFGFVWGSPNWVRLVNPRPPSPPPTSRLPRRTPSVPCPRPQTSIFGRPLHPIDRKVFPGRFGRFQLQAEPLHRRKDRASGVGRNRCRRRIAGRGSVVGRGEGEQIGL